VSAVQLRWRDGRLFDVTDSRGSTIIAGGTPDQDRGVKPSDLVPMGLAACVAYTFIGILQKQRQDVRAMEATVEIGQQPDPPWRFTSLHLHFVLTGEINETLARKALVRAEEGYCSVSASLRPTVRLTYDFEVRTPA